MRYLVSGGAGFVGSHVAQALLDEGNEVTILDNLSTGHRAAVPVGAQFHHVDLIDPSATNSAVGTQRWDAVLHFAALSLVADSMREPFLYLRQNTTTALNLIEACANHGIKKFVFSSTAALFGGNRPDPIGPSDPVSPSSPYGESKYIIERTLTWADTIYGMRSACLRYFNAAGADPLGRLGEDHRPETHLIPLVIDAALGRRRELKLFGSDYPTRDGTCVRDYVHVTDLASAHIHALGQLDDRSVVYNVGNGRGFTNLEVIQSVERVSGHSVPWKWAERRAGDPAFLVADSTDFRNKTGWTPQFCRLDDIVKTALDWRESHPNGYGHTPI